MPEGRLKRPACGSRKVVLLFDLPNRPMAKEAGWMTESSDDPQAPDQTADDIIAGCDSDPRAP
jgi:hypothetical protein